jgi:hypothetical protein
LAKELKKRLSKIQYDGLEKLGTKVLPDLLKRPKTHLSWWFDQKDKIVVERFSISCVVKTTFAQECRGFECPITRLSLLFLGAAVLSKYIPVLHK